MFSGSALLASLLPLLYVGGLLTAGVAVSLLLRRISTVGAFRQLHPWIPLLHIAVWGPIVFVLEGRLVPDFDGPRALGRALGLVVLAILGGATSREEIEVGFADGVLLTLHAAVFPAAAIQRHEAPGAVFDEEVHVRQQVKEPHELAAAGLTQKGLW